MKNITSLAEVL